ncbi:MAG: ABC transporter permease [Gammaproteobacteria bacterium]|nr:ABC transporter permease [Gammaproteobacteria bacterium]
MKRLINIQPSPLARIILAALPFIITLLLYLWISDMRLSSNPNDKLMPAFSSFATAISELAFTPSKRTGEYLFWIDTVSSLQRLLLGVSISALIGLIVGLLNGAIPLLRANLSPYITVLSLIPPMAILPILFIIFGLEELSKVILIVIGITPFIIRDLQGKTLELPSEQLIKAQTLGASTWQILLRVILPQMVPRLIEAIRLSLGPAWLFLISAEAIAAQSGLGYRIFLVRRYLSMDVILPYVVWITLLAFILDWLLRKLSQRVFPWFHDPR